MSLIANQWTGNGLAQGTDITTGNVNTPGNGASVQRAASGSPVFRKQGNGFMVQTANSADLARLDSALSGTVTAVRTQCLFTYGAATGALSYIQTVRNSGGQAAGLALDSTQNIALNAGGTTIVASRSPVLTVGDTYLLDAVFALSASPTTSNGRFFHRVTAVSNPNWNGGTGEFFYDSGYTQNLGTANFTQVRSGKQSVHVLGAPGLVYEYPGWESITVDPSDTSPSQAQAYFADPPGQPSPVSSPFKRWNGTSYVNLDAWRWNGTAYVTLESAG